MIRRWLLLLAVLAAAPAALAGQDSLPAPSDTVTADSFPAPPGMDTTLLKPPVTPMGALWRSLLLPGWGQARLNRKLTGALFAAWEGVTLGMSIKTSHELRYLRRTGSGSVRNKEREREDWLVLLAFNHLFSAIEAYVAAHLWDFPEDLEIRAAPVPGGVGAGVSIPFRIR